MALIMTKSEKMKLAQARSELVKAKEYLESGRIEIGILSVIEALAFVDLIYTVMAMEERTSTKAVG